MIWEIRTQMKTMQSDEDGRHGEQDQLQEGDLWPPRWQGKFVLRMFYESFHR